MTRAGGGGSITEKSSNFKLEYEVNYITVRFTILRSFSKNRVKAIHEQHTVLSRGCKSVTKASGRRARADRRENFRTFKVTRRDSLRSSNKSFRYFKFSVLLEE